MKVLDWVESEMILALWNLRYLTSEQIQRQWYPERSASGCLKRLSRLGQDGVLERVQLHDSRWRAAWRIGSAALRHLRETKHGEFPPSVPVSAKFVPHLLETNEVFLSVAGRMLVWDGLPFSWRGSHQVKLSYRRAQFRLGRDMPERGVIRPDAMLVPRDAAKPRVFIELDRSTECLSPKDGRRSIERKLDAYRRFLLIKHAEGSPYQNTFGDQRPARVLFVLSKRDARARDPKLRDRRVKAILELGERAFASEALVTCVYLDDTAALAQACGIDGPGIPVAEPAPPPKIELTRDELGTLRKLFGYYVHLWIRVRPESSVIAPAKVVGDAARELLTRLHPERKALPEIARVQGGAR